MGMDLRQYLSDAKSLGLVVSGLVTGISGLAVLVSSEEAKQGGIIDNRWNDYDTLGVGLLTLGVVIAGARAGRYIFKPNNNKTKEGVSR